MSTDENIIPVEVEAERESSTRSTVEACDFDLVVDEPENMAVRTKGRTL